MKPLGLHVNLKKTAAVRRLWESYVVFTDENYQGGYEISEHICICRERN
jgi:hypothetical protein